MAVKAVKRREESKNSLSQTSLTFFCMCCLLLLKTGGTFLHLCSAESASMSQMNHICIASAAKLCKDEQNGIFGQKRFGENTIQICSVCDVFNIWTACKMLTYLPGLWLSLSYRTGEGVASLHVALIGLFCLDPEPLLALPGALYVTMLPLAIPDTNFYFLFHSTHTKV